MAIKQIGQRLLTAHVHTTTVWSWAEHWAYSKSQLVVAHGIDVSVVERHHRCKVVIANESDNAPPPLCLITNADCITLSGNKGDKNMGSRKEAGKVPKVVAGYNADVGSIVCTL